MHSLAPRVAAVLSVIAVVGVTAGCASSSPTQPNSVAGANLPGGTNPAGQVKTNDTADKLTLKGQVTDAQTGKPLSKVTLLVVETVAAPAAPPPPPGPMASGSLPASSSAPASASLEALPPGPSATAAPVQKLDKPIEVKANTKGNFAIHDLPPGTYAITAFKRGYEAVTYQGGRPASGELDLVLVPNGAPTGNEITGKVILLNHKPAVGVHVAAALPSGLFASPTALTDADGDFTIDGLPSGKLTLAAWETGEPGEVRAWGYVQDIPVAYGKNRRSGHPQITLRAVTHPIILAGKVTSQAASVKPGQVQVFLETDASADIPLLSRAPDKDGYYRFSVPAPEANTAYHLVASGIDGHGDAAYAHLHDLAGPSHADDMSLPELPATPSMDVGAHTTWSWQPLPNVSAYRLRLESTGASATTLWEGWTTGTSITFPDIPGLELLKGDTYRYSLASINTLGAAELSGIALAPWSAASSLAPVEFIAGEKPKPAEVSSTSPTLSQEHAAPPEAPVAPPGVRPIPRPAVSIPARKGVKR